MGQILSESDSLSPEKRQEVCLPLTSDSVQHLECINLVPEKDIYAFAWACGKMLS